MSGSVVVVGGSAGLGKEIARHYADQGREVVLTSRDPGRAEAAVNEIGGDTTGVVMDLSEPHGIAPALDGLGPVQDLVLSAIERDENTVRTFDVAGATRLTTLQLVGYAEVIHALLPKFTDDAAAVVFGGLAKDRPYPGSTMVTTVNGGISTLVHTLVVELAAMR